MARFRVTEVDSAPDDLAAQVPFEFELLRRLPGPDRPNYWLAALSTPLRWGSKAITHLVLASRYVGSELSPEVRRVTLGIAYVTDDSLLNDAAFTFAKAAYVAVGRARVVAAS